MIIAMQQAMRSIRALCPLLLLACAALAGCPPSGPVEQATDCPTKFPESFPDSRSVEIGDITSGDFQQYADGGTIALRKGNQGLFMITPAIRVEARPGDGDEACFRVNLDSAFGNVPVGLLANVHFLKNGAFLESDGAIYEPLSSSSDKVEGVTGTLTATVKGEGFQGVRSITLTIK